MQSALYVSCRPVRDRAERCHAASPHPAQNHTGPPALAARIRSHAAGRTPLTRHTTTPPQRLPTLHGLARDSPCTGRRVPGSVAGEARLSPDAAAPALWWFERRTLRTATREIPITRAISRLLTPFACSSRIVVRCAWLNMFLLRSDGFGGGAGFECGRSDTARLRAAGDPTPW